MGNTYKIDGWKAVRLTVGGGAPDRLTLYRHGTRVWEMEIPPALPRDEWISIAWMVMAIYDKAWGEGFNACRRVGEESAS